VSLCNREEKLLLDLNCGEKTINKNRRTMAFTSRSIEMLRSIAS